jgi:hypothetical protein
MKTVLSIVGATALLASAASAAPLSPSAVAGPEASNIDQVRMVCNERGRCWRSRGTRYIQRSYGADYGDDDAYYGRRSYNYYGGPGYYSEPGYGYYGGGPSIGFSFGTGRW